MSVDRVIPFFTVANPVIAVCGVNSTVLTIPTIVFCTTNSITNLSVPVESVIVDDLASVSVDPALTNFHAVPVNTYT